MMGDCQLQEGSSYGLNCHKIELLAKDQKKKKKKDIKRSMAFPRDKTSGVQLLFKDRTNINSGHSHLTLKANGPEGHSGCFQTVSSWVISYPFLLPLF